MGKVYINKRQAIRFIPQCNTNTTTLSAISNILHIQIANLGNRRQNKKKKLTKKAASDFETASLSLLGKHLF